MLRPTMELACGPSWPADPAVMLGARWAKFGGLVGLLWASALAKLSF